MFNIYATDYAPVDPITPPCDIVPIFIGYKGENKARCLIFDLTECVETFGDGGFVISFIRQGDDLPYLVTDTDRLDNNAIWIITDTDTAVDGYGMVQLQYIVDDVVCKSALYRTVTFDSNSITGDVPDPYEDLLAQIAAYAAQAEGAATTATAAAQTATTAVEEGVKTERSQRIAADEGLNTRINELMGLAGAPNMANSAAAMTDSAKIYVYTGSEAGYINGHWYYYNGTEWADGGVYQATAINTDKTLTVENMAADAAVVGDRIDECMAAFVVNSASGSIASFTDGADGVPLKDLVVNIQPKQASGTPSPTNVLPITGWTEANITRCGKNCCPDLLSGGSMNGITYTRNVDGTITANGTSTGWSTLRSTAFTVKAGTYIYSQGDSMTNGAYAALTNPTNPNQAYVSLNGSTGYKTVTFTEDTSVMIGLTVSPNMTLNNYVFAIQLEVGNTKTAYEQYNGNTYNVSFGSAGTVYGGTLDVTTGMLTVTCALTTLNGSESWNLNGTSSNSSRFTVTISSTATVTNTDDKVRVTCSNMSGMSAANILGANTQPYNVAVISNHRLYVTAPTTIDTAVKFKEWLTNNNMTVVYEAAQPISYQLTPTEVKSLLANNNIFVDTGSVASCEYRADTKLYLEKLTNPDDDMVANANITSGSYFMVGNNLYLATANIANGGAITPGTNCTATNLAAALNAINS